MGDNETATVAQMVVGLRLSDAQAFIAERGMQSRVVSQDGMSFYFTTDYHTRRINLEVIDDVVVGTRVG